MTNKDKCPKFGYVGPEASGKTFRALHDSRNERAIIRLNPTGEDQMQHGADVVYTRGEIVRALQAGDRRSKRVISFEVPASMSGLAAFDAACKIAIAYDGRCAVFLNEGESLFSRHDRMTVSITDVIRKGYQHCQVPLYWTAQRLQNMNVDLRGNTHFTHIYKASDPTYTKFLRERCGPQAVEAMKNLAKFECLRVNMGGDYKKLKKI